MKISTTTFPYCTEHGTAAAIRLIAAAGFDCYDFSVFDVSEKPPLYRDGWRAYAADLRMIADAAGITCNQSHAPFPTSKLPKPENEGLGGDHRGPAGHRLRRRFHLRGGRLPEAHPRRPHAGRAGVHAENREAADCAD